MEGKVNIFIFAVYFFWTSFGFCVCVIFVNFWLFLELLKHRGMMLSCMLLLFLFVFPSLGNHWKINSKWGGWGKLEVFHWFKLYGYLQNENRWHLQNFWRWKKNFPCSFLSQQSCASIRSLFYYILLRFWSIPKGG